MRWDQDYVSHAGKQDHIIAGFDVFGYEDAQAVVRAAERAQSPVLLMINRDARRDLELVHWSALLHSLANEAKVPVGVHLDHCSDLEMVRYAIDAGFTSVTALIFSARKCVTEDSRISMCIPFLIFSTTSSWS